MSGFTHVSFATIYVSACCLTALFIHTEHIPGLPLCIDQQAQVFTLCLCVGNLPTFSKELSITTSPDDVAVTYELQPGAGCLLSEGYLQAQICYILFTQELECSAAILSDSNVNCSSITTEQGSITLQRYYKYCIVAEISSNVLEPAYLHLTVPANESVPTSKPSSLTVDIVGSALEIWWEAPPFEKWNGIPDSYCLNISVDGMLVNTTRVPTSRNYSHFPSYDSGKTYDIMLSCCTSIGCGPVAVNTIPSRFSVCALAYFYCSSCNNITENLCL